MIAPDTEIAITGGGTVGSILRAMAVKPMTLATLQYPQYRGVPAITVKLRDDGAVKFDQVLENGRRLDLLARVSDEDERRATKSAVLTETGVASSKPLNHILLRSRDRAQAPGRPAH